MIDFQMKLLEKIQELTLDSVQQAKTIRLKDAQIAELDARLALLERMMERLEKRPQWFRYLTTVQQRWANNVLSPV
jgi:uncharacterized protein (DUF3084 family)